MLKTNESSNTKKIETNNNNINSISNINNSINPRESNIFFSRFSNIVDLSDSQNDLVTPLSDILFWKIKEFTKEKFETALNKTTSLQEVIDITLKFAEDLVIVKEKMVQCFPPRYNIFERYLYEYQTNIYNSLYPYLKEENEEYLEENKSDLILFAKWLDGYEHIIRRVGIDVNQCEIGGVKLIIKI
jgi:hypothetical protein